MKKLAFLLVAICFLFSLQAAQVAEDHALSIAQSWYRAWSNNSLRSAEVTDVVNKVVNDNTVYRIFNFAQGGFVIIAGDDCVKPILAYSYESRLGNDANPEVSYFLHKYTNQISEKIAARVIDSEAIALWRSADRGDFNSYREERSVDPLITTNWNQDYPYNALCPADADGPGGHAYAGCVASAAGQVMKYWGYPTQGTGSHSYTEDTYGTLSANFGATTYNWAGMPSYTETYNEAIATLLYHIGVAVDMDYAADGSGSNSSRVVNAFPNYFGYTSNMINRQMNSYSEETWFSMLKTELDSARPVYYSGYEPGSFGHAFVCDGYNAADYFHFNWGWGGSGNGYFSLDNLNSGNGNFSTDESAIFSFYPNTLSTVMYPPENLTASVNDTDVTLNWEVGGPIQAVDTIDDSFDNYTSFATSFRPWTTIDVDGGNTWAFYGTDFPGAGEPMSYIIFSATETDPPFAQEVAHSGTKVAACFNTVTASAPNNDWLITPLLNVQNDYEFSFWAKTYSTQYGLERFRVAVSTTDTNPASFTTVLTPGNYVEPPTTWTQYSYSLSQFAGQTVYIGIQCISPDRFIFLVDDVYAGPMFGRVAREYNPESTIALDRTAHPRYIAKRVDRNNRVLEGFRVYRDGMEIAQIDSPSILTYVDSDLPGDQYTYTVRAVYSEGISEPSNGATVTVQSGPNPPPTGLTASVENFNNIKLNWTSPGGGFSEMLYWGPGDFQYIYGPGFGPSNNSCAQRFSPANLAPYEGRYLTVVGFVPCNEFTTYTVKVWVGGTATTPGTLVFNQVVSAPTLNEWNAIPLTTPLEIDPTQELWIGLNANCTASSTQLGRALALDGGPAVDGFGDLFYSQNAWVSLHQANPAIDFNWSLVGLTEDPEGRSSLPLTALTDNMPTSSSMEIASLTRSNIHASVASLAERSSRYLEGFNIYRNNVLVGQVDDASTEEYLDTALAPGRYEYYLTSRYSDGVESSPSRTVETAFSLPEPTDVQARIVANTSFVISWTAVSVPTRELLNYRIYRDGAVVGTSTSTAYRDTNVQPNVEYSYYVTAIYSGDYESPHSNTVHANIVDAENNVNIPVVTALGGNYPNPFNPRTEIAYSLKEKGKVSLEIYNILGQKVKTLINTTQEAGEHKIAWNGRDNRNKEVASGIYFYKMQTGKYSSTKKMILMK